MTGGGGGIPSTPNATDDAGRKTGPWTDPDPHGGVMIGSYVDGARDGVWRHLSSDGRLRASGGFSGGELDGEWRWYRSDGAPMQRGAFHRGRKTGTWERWDAAGRAIDRGDYRDDRKVGEWLRFGPDGEVSKTTRHTA
ncbi:hypothetical protein QSU92_15670 [Microbacterium sp. ET2]|uniref:toxin-antitoxin system YwqK family antitoxin n=1 Tax=Microbacterium albipurpureum TaxID=3050384 RepID=UPI00259CFEA9|nr:hypothetical protein [Microbacterium sp. ET2 (Ac-2212)]WJL95356.1 hypothetical protein QSU92_15670 [Microbacterium sp. ET2 (Ac-2212)]